MVTVAVYCECCAFSSARILLSLCWRMHTHTKKGLGGFDYDSARESSL